MSDVHNLNEGVLEYFEFVVNGAKYKFRQLNTLEMDQLQKVNDTKDDKKIMEFITSFVTKDTPETPEFSETYKTMTIPVLKNFFKMLATEFSA